MSINMDIFLDRYSQRNPDISQVKPGDTVIVQFKVDNEFKPMVTVCKENTGTHIVTEDGDSIEYRYVDFPCETPEDVFRRVSTLTDEPHQEETFKLLSEYKFVPGGRILSSGGTGRKTTMYNCFVIPSPKDSREGIYKTMAEQVEIMARGGGVGFNISTLRPSGSRVKKVDGRSCGVVQWANLFSMSTNTVQQGGSRRGALMIILNDWHPDILEFISAKKNPNMLNYCNISIGISDEFMDAVKNDGDWDLRFPDTSHNLYDLTWNGVLEEYQGPIQVIKTVKAREIWDAIIESAWASAEPGVWFRGRANKMSNHGTLIATNPCGEISLPEYGVCNLGHINLAKIETLVELEKAIRLAVRFLDNVIDKTMYPIEAMREVQQKERRIGLGTLGLAEHLIRKGLRYGSDECCEYLDSLYSYIKDIAYDESAKLQEEKGGPGHLNLAYSDGSRMYRNCQLLTQAPTGTTGTMLGTSTGIEPFFYWEFVRSSRIGKILEEVSVYREWNENNPGKELPDYFVTAMDLNPEDHVKVQSVIQKHVDASISKTVNCPNSYTIKDVEKVYMELYNSGCKGGTIYRDGSRSVQVLNLKDETEFDESNRKGTTKTVKCNLGTVHVTMNEDSDGNVREVFLNIGKAGSDTYAIGEAVGRLATMILKKDPSRKEELVKNLRGIGGSSKVGFGKNSVKSLPDAVGIALDDEFQEGVMNELCSECGMNTMVREGSCGYCTNCSHQKCS